jgi:hypothetical protein
MKTNAFLTILWAVLTLGCLSAPAQESNREVGSVDASVRASVEKGSTEPGPSQGSVKRATTFSNWSALPARPDGATIGWTALSTRTNTIGSPDSATGSLGKLRKSPSNGGSLSGGQVRRSSMFTEAGATAQPTLPPFEIRAFPSSFKKKQSGLTENFSKTDSFPSKGLKAKRHNSRPPRSTDFRVSDPVRSTAVGKR